MKQVNHRKRVIIICVITAVVWALSMIFSTIVRLQQVLQGEDSPIFPDWYEMVALSIIVFVYIPLSILLQHHAKLANIKPILYISRVVFAILIMALILGIISLC